MVWFWRIQQWADEGERGEDDEFEPEGDHFEGI